MFIVYCYLYSTKYVVPKRQACTCYMVAGEFQLPGDPITYTYLPLSEKLDSSLLAVSCPFLFVTSEGC